jgi:UDP-N-acetylmuramoyl-L-alanyl-D-glutamate--2,6-diaminopimelate ligase
MGRAGEAALELLSGAIGVDGLSAWDSNDGKVLKAKAARWRARGVTVALGGDGVEALGAAGASATIVKSPGIDFETPLLRAAAGEGRDVIDELELGWRAAAGPVFAVAGTNGKSTTCALVASILRAAGQRAQLVGNTEFGPPLSSARRDAAIVCEVSSFQLEAAPTFLPDIAIFTNLSPEHLPRHGSMEAYGEVKQRMFVRGARASGVSIVNIDDERGRHILAAVKQAGGKTISYGFSPDADVRIDEARWTMRKAHTLVQARGRAVSLESQLPGRHNALNIAAACAFAEGAGLEPESVVSGVRDAVAPAGRWQLIDEGQNFDVVVDYAHTPDGLFQFLSAARAVTSARGSALRTVFGAVGLPDPPKARGCAEAARSLSDQLVLTSGSAPRSPRILRLRELRDAARSIGPVEIRLERRDAIAHAIVSAHPGDVVAILGLGALRSMALDASGAAWPNDDRQTARTLLRSLASCDSS